VEFGKSCSELEVERSDWEDEKTMIADTTEAPFEWLDKTCETWNITQTADGIYHGELKISDASKQILTICTGCNKGFYNNNGGEVVFWRRMLISFQTSL